MDMTTQDEIIKQARSKNPPNSWMVLSAQRSTFTVIVKYGAYSMLIYLGVFIFLVFFIISLSAPMRDAFKDIFIFMLILGLVSFIPGIIYGAVKERHVSNDPPPLLVIMEDGFVEYIDSRTSIEYISFWDFSTIRLCLSGSVVVTILGHRPNVSAYLELQSKEGEIRYWYERAYFKPEAELYQDIITAFTKYKYHNVE